MRKTTEELVLEAGLFNGEHWLSTVNRMETFRRLVIENERECAEAVGEVRYNQDGELDYFYLGTIPAAGTKLFTFPPADIDRDSVIEECARLINLIGKDWLEADEIKKSYACDYLVDSLRALKSQPAAPDPRDEALREAKEALFGVIRRASANGGYIGMDGQFKVAKEALAAINKVMKEMK